MSSTSLTVIVISPDEKHRVTITVPLHTTIKQLAILACQKHGINDANVTDYRLRHGRNLLAEHLPLRLSGLAAGAKLDLVLPKSSNKADSGAEGGKMVYVGVQYVGSHCALPKERWIRLFPSNTVLWHILQVFAKEHPAFRLIFPQGNDSILTPHLMIMNQEYHELNILCSSTLTAIGINKGDCLIRVSHRLLQGSLADAQKIVDELSASPIEPPETTTDLITEPSAASLSEASCSPSIQTADSTSTQSIVSGSMASLSGRNVILYRPPVNRDLQHLSHQHPGDEFYETRELDVRLQYSSLKTRTTKLLEAPLLSHQKLQERRQQELLTRHPTTTIRFRLPDQHQIQATFHSTEVGLVLFKFISSIFREDSPISSNHVSLSMGPPPRTICIERDGNLPLWQLDLIPNALINVMWRPPSKDILSCLRKEIVDTLTDNPTFLNESGPSTSVIPSSTRPEASGTFSTKKKPSWLRL